MENSKPKTLEDFHHFNVTGIRRSATSDDGYFQFDLEGIFDTIPLETFDHILDGTGPQWFWLLYGERGWLTPTLKSFNKQTRTTVLSVHEKEELNLLGQKVVYLSTCWQAFNIWMVLDPNWGWERKHFQGIDAVAEDYEARDISILDGREVRVWTKLEPVGTDRGQSRHYPATDQTVPVQPGTRLVPGAWGHEHCGLCNEHIDAGMFGYSDPDERWVCESCHDRYITRHDLAFVDEL